MPVGPLLTALGPHVMAVIPLQVQPFLELSPPVLAAESSTITAHGAPSIRPAATGVQADYPAMSNPDASPPPELVVYLGDRRSGPQLELGALGGGRADAPSLVHVGFGFNF